MLPFGIFERLSPHARVATAIAPFVMAMAIRLFLGKNRVSSVLLSLSTVWFTINVLMAPYSNAMRRDIEGLLALFR